MNTEHEKESVWFKSLNEDQQKDIRSIALEDEKSFIEKFFKDKFIYDTLNYNNLSVYSIYHDSIKYPNGVLVTTPDNNVVDVRTDPNNNASLFIKTLLDTTKLVNTEIKDLENKNLSQLLHESKESVKEVYLAGELPKTSQQMAQENIYQSLIKEFGLDHLPQTDQEELLHELANTIQKQFLLDVFDDVGEEKFKALEASLDMGAEFYNTTLKHLVPTYDEIFQNSRTKVLEAFKS